MSASSKKKLRKEQDTAQLTKRQQQERAEAKKLKIYTITFVCVIALAICITAGVLIGRSVNRSGILQKNTVAVTIGDHELSSVELNYFLLEVANDQYNEWYETYGSYTDTFLQMFYGLDATKSLDRQYYDEENNTTWADFFIERAIEVAKETYTLYDAAIEAGFELTEDKVAEVDDYVALQSEFAELYSVDVDEYMSYMYGYGSDTESYRDHLMVQAYANGFSSTYYDELSYDDAAIREREADRYNEYTSYAFAYYALPYSSFLGEGTTDEDGNVTHTDAEIEAALAAAKAAADSLTKAASVEEFDKLIADLTINEENTSAASTKYEEAYLSEMKDIIAEWISSSDRAAGDITVLENITTTENEDGTETSTLNGYYVLYFQGYDENLIHLGNVRHLLVQFEGGTYNSETGETEYSDDEKAAAKATAEELLNTWKKGAATEESFIELIKEHSDDSSAEAGGLYEDIAPDGTYVENFENWSTDPTRETGDVEIIETEYGYHIMYYVNADELTYRDYLILTELKDEAYNAWYEDILEAVTTTVGNTSKLSRDMILSTSA